MGAGVAQLLYWLAYWLEDRGIPQGNGFFLSPATRPVRLWSSRFPVRWSLEIKRSYAFMT